MATSLVVQRLAGVSGALAVAAGAYGAHGFKNKDPEDYSRVLYETANKYHFYHSIALLGASRCRKPAVVCTVCFPPIIIITSLNRTLYCCNRKYITMVYSNPPSACILCFVCICDL
uniref:Transmembrane protein 256 n=1 Tax=Salmo trutta TaxID=8032 RepID=A0A674EBJ7_SALTR